MDFDASSLDADVPMFAYISALNSMSQDKGSVIPVLEGFQMSPSSVSIDDWPASVTDVSDSSSVASNHYSSISSAVKTPFLPPCRVCNSPASGFHYGVNTCEACKGFFHRSLRRSSPYKCAKDGKCHVALGGRSSCTACRYKCCLEVGMTKEAVKTGRYTHRKRTQDTLEIKRLQRASPTAVELTPEVSAGPHSSALEDAAVHDLMVRVTAAFEQAFTETCVFYNSPEKIESLKQDMLRKHGAMSGDCVMFGNPEEQLRLRDVRVEREALTALNCDFSGGDDTMYGVRNAEIFKYWAERMELLVRSLVSFAKSIPGYTDLPMQDQITLIKAGRPEVTHLLKYKHLDLGLNCVVDYDAAKNVINLVPVAVMRRVWQDDEFCRMCCAGARRLQALRLAASDVALLMAIALASPDREHLMAPDQVEAMQNSLVPALQHSIAINHGGDRAAVNRTLAILLLHLPQMREHNERNNQMMAKMHNQCPNGLPPLLQECCSTSEQPDKECRY